MVKSFLFDYFQTLIILIKSIKRPWLATLAWKSYIIYTLSAKKAFLSFTWGATPLYKFLLQIIAAIF